MDHPEREPKITPLTFQEVIDIASETTLKEGYHDPTFIVDGTQEVVFARPQRLADTPKDRWQQMFILGSYVAGVSGEGSIRGVFFVAQSLVSRPKSQEMAVASSAPNRVEVLVISGYDVAAGKVKTALFELLRDEDGLVYDLLDLKVGQDDADPADTPLLMAFVEGLSSK